jgi:hypothetical protein
LDSGYEDDGFKHMRSLAEGGGGKYERENFQAIAYVPRYDLTLYDKCYYRVIAKKGNFIFTIIRIHGEELEKVFQFRSTIQLVWETFSSNVKQLAHQPESLRQGDEEEEISNC